MAKHSILMVDDEPHILNAFQRALRKESYAVMTAESGEEGLKLLEAREFSLVISDYNMPQMNGLEFFRTVKTLYPHLLTIMLTGQAEMNIAIQAINEAGVYKFIQKPWDNAELKITILRALEAIDLATERDRLLQKVKSRDAILEELEHKYPGITQVERDDDGYLILKEESG
jgi:two-component system, probable response regulator PhcQ